jgi:hypothetical protein
LTLCGPATVSNTLFVRPCWTTGAAWMKRNWTCPSESSSLLVPGGISSHQSPLSTPSLSSSSTSLASHMSSLQQRHHTPPLPPPIAPPPIAPPSPLALMSLQEPHRPEPKGTAIPRALVINDPTCLHKHYLISLGPGPEVQMQHPTPVPRLPASSFPHHHPSAASPQLSLPRGPVDVRVCVWCVWGEPLL